jgi:predicted Zn-dependent protease
MKNPEYFMAQLKNYSTIILFCFLFISKCAFAQVQDADAYKQADSVQDKSQKIIALKNFVSSYPESQYKTNALLGLFQIYLNDNNIDTALIYADQAVNVFPERLRANIYNEVAYTLAQKKVGLDTAAVYAQRAVNGARNNSPRYLGMILDTQALVMYDLGKADSAMALELEAIKGYKDDPSFLSSLAIYQEAAGHRLDGLKTAAEAILQGNTDEALTNFNNWIEKEKPTKKEQDKLRKSIAESTLKIFFAESKKEDKYNVNCIAAAFLACVKVNMKQADKWIKEAVSSLNNNSDINNRILFTKTYGQILFEEGKYKEALKALNSIEDLVDPWESNFWYTLGKTYEKVNDNQKAFDAYFNGSIVIQPLNLQNALLKLGSKEGLNEDKIKSLITKKRDELLSFNPGHYKGSNPDGNVVLAELFTGAECGPCAGADYAFEDLAEYFTRNEVAILEYHLHIPGPDPMTNPDTFGRYSYYGKDFGTPTVFIQGKSKIGGGGPKYLAKNRFNIYRHTIENYLNSKSYVKIDGSAKNNNDSVSVNLKIQKTKNIENNISLHIVLTEKSVQYLGSNGVSKHIFVVRSLNGGVNGMQLKSDKGNETISSSFNLTGIETGLSKYLDDPTKDPSWRNNLPIPQWKKRTDKLDRKNLAVVAWVQNNKTKEILQSIYLDLPGNNLSEGNK